LKSEVTTRESCGSGNNSVDLFPLPQLSLVVSSDFNGYAISCFGESDGSAQANVNGIPLFDYTWSTGDTTQSITGLSAGSYAITITDGNGCDAEGDILLQEPQEFSIGFLITEPGCFETQQGTIEVIASGGVQPIRYSIDAVNYQSAPAFTNLPSGTYTISALDANDCEAKEVIWINVPLPVNVELGDDMIIQPGDTTIIEAIVDIPIDSLSNVSWTGLSNTPCPTCLAQPVAPIITTAYSIAVTNTSGCSDSDDVIIFVEKNIDVYVPNIFSPNGDNVNDRLIISAGPEVEEIESMEIFDRWGNMVFAKYHFLPDDPGSAWDGGEYNSGVFAYRMMARFKDGRFEVRNGDVTLLR
jgi:gliding motility-associated-like protein